MHIKFRHQNTPLYHQVFSIREIPIIRLIVPSRGSLVGKILGEVSLFVTDFKINKDE